MRQTTYWQQQLLEIASDCSALGSTLFVLIVVLLATLSDRTAAARLAVGFACVEACGNTIKFLWHRNRPEAQPHETHLERLDAGSFPSIHTARSAMIAVVAGGLWGWFPWWAAATVLVGVSRIVLRKHRVGDVIGGAILGLSAGWLVMRML